jgi:hypothetical protein
VRGWRHTRLCVAPRNADTFRPSGDENFLAISIDYRDDEFNVTTTNRQLKSAVWDEGPYFIDDESLRVWSHWHEGTKRHLAF